jgi:hypothetical protein
VECTQQYVVLAPAVGRWFVMLPLSFQTVMICLPFVVSSAIMNSGTASECTPLQRQLGMLR